MCEWIKGASLHPRYAQERMEGPGHTCRPAVWDRGTAFESRDPDISSAELIDRLVVWDKGTAFESAA
jgi:hypothetical protein